MREGEGDAAGLGLVEPSGCHKIKGSTNTLGAKPAGAERAGGAATPKPSMGTAPGIAGGVAGTTLGATTAPAPLGDWGGRGSTPVTGAGGCFGEAVWARTGAASKAITAAAPRVIGRFWPMVALKVCRKNLATKAQSHSTCRRRAGPAQVHQACSLRKPMAPTSSSVKWSISASVVVKARLARAEPDRP